MDFSKVDWGLEGGKDISSTAAMMPSPSTPFLSLFNSPHASQLLSTLLPLKASICPDLHLFLCLSPASHLPPTLAYWLWVMLKGCYSSDLAVQNSMSLFVMAINMNIEFHIALKGYIYIFIFCTLIKTDSLSIYLFNLILFSSHFCLPFGRCCDSISKALLWRQHSSSFSFSVSNRLTYPPTESTAF